jgi:hypothetical protein
MNNEKLDADNLESPEDERLETTEQQKQEKQKGEEAHEDSFKEGVTVPEEFQKQVHALIAGADKHKLAHIRDRVFEEEDRLRRLEQEKHSKKSNSKYDTEVFTDAGSPVEA